MRMNSPVLDNALAILVISRVVGALVNIVHDCDEVFNYWEPLHFILYGYGAFQSEMMALPRTRPAAAAIHADLSPHTLPVSPDDTQECKRGSTALPTRFAPGGTLCCTRP